MTELDVDVAIAGGGAAGIMAALRASEDPELIVAVYEKSTREGSNAAISSGSLAAGGTRFQRAAGIDDSPSRHAADILAASGDEEWRPIVEAVCAAAPAVVEWIADSGYPVEVGVDLSRAGMSVPRLHSDIGRLGGGRLMRHLRAVLDTRPNVAFVDEAPAVGLLREDGAVTGMVVSQNGDREDVRAAATVLAVDGFAATSGWFRNTSLPSAIRSTAASPRAPGTRCHGSPSSAYPAQPRRRPALRARRCRPRHPRVSGTALQRSGPGQPAGRTLRRRGGARLLVPVRHPAAAARREGRPWCRMRPPWPSPANRR